MNRFIVIVLIANFLSCNKVGKGTLFTLTDSDVTGIRFENNLPYTEEFNAYTYRNFYNGGGVALGDFNNDGLLDIYFTGNIADNKLYINQGNWAFEDITTKAGVDCKGVWSAGATVVDINGDGWQDIYVCKAGMPGGERRHNELFINQGNLTFKESANEYGLDIVGLSIHSAFLDYDRDGDLDCYILNNSMRAVGGFDLKEGLRNIADAEGNKFFRNDGGRFIDVTTEVGVYSSSIGYGLGITASDFNGDDWPDLFISNDFFERDYLYLNQKNGTFKEVADQQMTSLSMGSMGADASDIDNDMRPDLFVTEMLPTSLERKKTKAQYDNWDKYTSAVRQGYHHQFPRNVLQRNLGNGSFVELGRLAGVSASEWSWAALSQDFDNDGNKDIFISNGIYKDLLDKDYLNFIANDAVISNLMKTQKEVIKTLLDSIPSEAVSNHMYRGDGNFQFENVAESWGLATPTWSNGSAYGDLDNDGDLDLVLNNANMPAFVYMNNTDTSMQRSITISLKGANANKYGMGAKAIGFVGGKTYFVENFTSRGFESTIDHRIHMGVGQVKILDSLVLIWPTGGYEVKYKVPTNKVYTYDEKNKRDGSFNYLTAIQEANTVELPFVHKDVDLNLFTRERTLMQMDGFDGPAIAVGDVNNDGFDDAFVGGGKGQHSALLYGNKNGWGIIDTTSFAQDKNNEVTAAKCADLDGDGDLDLYVGHGGKSFSVYSPELDDICYINNGNAKWSRVVQDLGVKVNTSDIEIGDINGDGKPDVIVAEGINNGGFGAPCSMFIGINQGKGYFKWSIPAGFKDIGMINEIEWVDYNGDGKLDLAIAGRWMPLMMALNTGSGFDPKPRIVPNSEGLWNAMVSVDIDSDGDRDLVMGNEGLNSNCKAGMQVFVNDFDENGSVEPIFCENIGGKYYPIHDVDELYSQLPMLKKKYLYYKNIAKEDMVGMFGKDKVDKSNKYSIEEIRTSLWIQEKGKMTKVVLPMEAQYSCVNAILPIIDQKNSKFALYLGGNHYAVKPQFGRQDASSGWKMVGSVSEGKVSFTKVEMMGLKGQIRSFQSSDKGLIVGINKGRAKVYNLQGQ